METTFCQHITVGTSAQACTVQLKHRREFFVSWTGKLMKKTADETSLSQVKISSTMDAERVFVVLQKTQMTPIKMRFFHYHKQTGTTHLLSESQG